MFSSDSWLIDIGERSHPNPMHRSSGCSSATSKTGNRFGWSFFFAVWRRCARSQLHMNSVVLVESQGSCALVRIVRLQKFQQEGQHDLHSPPQPIDWREHTIGAVHDRNLPTQANKYQKVTKISCNIWSRFEESWLDCVTMMSQMTIGVIVVSASCHRLIPADHEYLDSVAWPCRGGTSVAPWRHKCSHVPVFPPFVWPSSRSNFDLGPSPSDSTEKTLSYQSLWFWSAVFL